jgi:EAL domain-containing protein (putative c-di-GMP-specific phosphodiesterase class I)
MVGGIVSLGRTMGLEALAEGVETPEEEAALTQLGCSHVQGFGIAETHAACPTRSHGWQTATPAGQA